MAITDKIVKIADKTRELTGLTNKMTLDEILVNMDLIKTTPILQNKSITITENKTINITADKDYDGLNKVDITTNVGSNLNIFVQEEEPIEKNGVWLKINNLEYDTVEFVSDNSDNCVWDRYQSFGSNRRRECGVALVGDYLYIFGGTMSSSTPSTTYAQKYNIQTGEITVITAYPISAYGMLCIAYGTDIYCFGGRKSSGGGNTNAYKYDTLSNSYTEISNIPIAVGQLGGTRVGENIYMFGGTTSAGRITSAYKYNIPTDTYTQIANLPTIRNTVAVTSIGTNIYIFGGLGVTDSLADAYKYDTFTDTYTKLKDVPHAGFGMGAVALDNQIYVFGGVNGSAINKAYLYNPATDTYTQIASMFYPTGRIYNSVAIKDNVIYVVGGEGGTTTTYTNDPITPFAIQYVQKGIINSLSYQNVKNTLIICCREDGMSTNLTNNTTCKLTNAFYYSIEEGLDKTIPVYCGNGTEWIKINN